MSTDSIDSRVRRSILTLQGRQAAILLVQLGVGVVLARKLGPAAFGLYGIASFCLSILSMATDFGLAGSLVQRKKDFGEHEISVAFTLQLGTSVAASVLVWLAAPLALLVYRSAPSELVWLIRSLTVPMMLSAVATTAKLQLEREILFHKVATIDIVQAVVSSGTTLAAVFAGAGVWSFVAGNIAGSVAAAGTAWAMVRHRPRLAWDGRLARELLAFGIPFQFSTITNDAAGWVIPLISGAALGPAAVGLLTWASSNGRRPLMVVENVMRVAFPHFSRLQDHPEELGRQVGLYLRRLVRMCALWTFLAFLLGAQMTHLVYTDKWMPGVVALQLFAAGLLVDIANWVGGMSLNAIGGVKTTAKWTTAKSVLSIGGSFALLRIFGMEGIPLASILASTVSGAGILVHLRRRIPLDLGELATPLLPFLAGAAAYLPLHFAGGGVRLAGAWGVSTALAAWTAWTTWRELAAGRKAARIEAGS